MTQVANEPRDGLLRVELKLLPDLRSPIPRQHGLAGTAEITVDRVSPATLVLRNGKIVTMSSARPVAQAIAMRGDRVSALGTDNEAPQWIGPNTKVIDLHGMLAIPGFIEGHGHFTGVGEFRMGLDLREARTWDDIVAQLRSPGTDSTLLHWTTGPRTHWVIVEAI